MVRDVSEDPVYHTIEFNEFLQLLSKQQRSGTNYDSLKDAFSIFDKDDDGYIPVNEMRDILQSLGDKMTDQELDEMMAAADSDQDGFINYEGKHSVRHKGAKILFTKMFSDLSTTLTIFEKVWSWLQKIAVAPRSGSCTIRLYINAIIKRYAIHLKTSSNTRKKPLHTGV